MKLVSYSHDGREDFGAVVGDQVVPLAARTGHADLAAFIGSADYARRDEIVKAAKPELALAAVELLPVIPRAEKIVCAVRNYMDHHKEVLAAGMHRELSEEPPIF